MSTQMFLQTIYHILLLVTFGIGLRYRELKVNKIILGLLLTSIITEAGAVYFYYVLEISHYWIYTIYIPFEHIFIMMYLKEVGAVNVKKKVQWTIWTYLIVTVAFWFYQGGLNRFPMILYNIHGIIVITYSIFILFHLDPKTRVPLINQSKLWFLSGFIIFFSAMFCINQLHDYIIKLDHELLRKFRLIFMKVVNYALYISMIIGFICSKKQIPK